MTLQMNFHLRPYNQYILNIVTNIYLGLDFFNKISMKRLMNDIGKETLFNK